MSSTLKIGLIGCGRAAELIYLPALKRFPDIEITAVIDLIKERRELFSEKFNKCFRHTSIDADFISRIDAAIISSPPDTHITLASALLKNNKYVLVEKPLALSMNGIKDLSKIESSSEASLMMGFNHRYWQPVVNLKEKLSRGLKVSSAEIIFTSNYSNWNPVSFISDPLNDLGPHVFDVIRFTFEREIFSIAARSLNENNLEVKMKLIGDTVIHSFIAHSNRTVKSVKVTSDAGKYFIALGSERIHPEFGNKGRLLDLGDNIKRKLLRRLSPIKKSHEVQLNNFFNFAKSMKPANPGIKDGIKAILAVEASLKSINEKGKEIILDETN